MLGIRFRTGIWSPRSLPNMDPRQLCPLELHFRQVYGFSGAPGKLARGAPPRFSDRNPASLCFNSGKVIVYGTTGEPEPERAEGQAEASQAPGAARAPTQCRDKGWNRNRTETVTTSLIPASDAASNVTSSRELAMRARTKVGDYANAKAAVCRWASMQLVATCTDDGDRRGVVAQSDWDPRLALARPDVGSACPCSRSRGRGPLGNSRRTR